MISLGRSVKPVVTGLTTAALSLDDMASVVCDDSRQNQKVPTVIGASPKITFTTHTAQLSFVP